MCAGRLAGAAAVDAASSPLAPLLFAIDSVSQIAALFPFAVA